MRALIDTIARDFAESAMLDDETRRDAGREARLLAAAVLDLAPGVLARRLDDPWSHADLERVRLAALRRVRGEPLAYSVGTAAFRNLVLRVDSRVLIPRPETEIVVDTALSLVRDCPGGIAVDIGTGSGAIALSLASEGRFARVIATDVSSDALQVARDNATRLSAECAPVEFRIGSDLAPLAGLSARVIVSNPPYIAYAEAEQLPRSVRDWEPATALYAADNGMARYDAMLRGAALHLESTGWIVCEVDSRRAQLTLALATSFGFDSTQLLRDLTGRERVLVARNSAQAVALAHALRGGPTDSAVARQREVPTTPVHNLTHSNASLTTSSGPEAGYHARR